MLTHLLRKCLSFLRQSHERRIEGRILRVIEGQREELRLRVKRSQPRVLVVKQDVNEDLYCCAPESDVQEVIKSTLLRTGPVALFTELNAEFRIVETVDDPECEVWKERATLLRWDSLEFFTSYRDHIPGRDYGQKRWALALDAIDWGSYDVVISVDICVPRRITRLHPETLWCYFVREVKSPSYSSSLILPAIGQDLVLNHQFRLLPKFNRSHVLEFPYHLQNFGCFHRLFRLELPATDSRSGVFVDHHTMIKLTSAQRHALEEFGPVASTIHEGTREIIPTSEQLARRTMDEDLRDRLFNSRYFLITPGQRRVFGTALVEAIAAGCLAIGSSQAFGDHGYLFSLNTSASDFDDALAVIRRLERDRKMYTYELERQRGLIDYVCFVRPLNELLDALERKRNREEIT